LYSRFSKEEHSMSLPNINAGLKISVSINNTLPYLEKS
jgi:hypothetical protein